MHAQLALFETVPALPAGFRYQEDLVRETEERALLAALPDVPFEFRGLVGQRRVVSFGSRYAFASGRMHAAASMPDVLLALRDRAAAFAGLAAEALAHALVTEYTACVAALRYAVTFRTLRDA